MVRWCFKVKHCRKKDYESGKKMRFTELGPVMRMVRNGVLIRKESRRCEIGKKLSRASLSNSFWNQPATPWEASGRAPS